MAESSNSSADNNAQPSDGKADSVVALIQAARAKPATTYIESILGPPPSKGVPPDVAMSALWDMEEEPLREALQDPKTTEEKRVEIKQQLELDGAGSIS